MRHLSGLMAEHCRMKKKIRFIFWPKSISESSLRTFFLPAYVCPLDNTACPLDTTACLHTCWSACMLACLAACLLVYSCILIHLILLLVNITAYLLGSLYAWQLVCSSTLVYISTWYLYACLHDCWSAWQLVCCLLGSLYACLLGS